jgi:phosphoglycolate phosphatase-like HAD superfamily hydrolase
LKSKVEKSSDPVLKQALEWSQAVNTSVADMIHNVPPFPYVQESLDKISQYADIMVCSAMPYQDLIREWQEYDLAKYILIFAGQEMGSKKEQIQLCSENRYKKENVIMIGDAPGDLRAARANNAKYYPINPGYEEESWELFFKQASDMFFTGDYGDKYEAKLIQGFEKLLPDTPPWK